MDQKVTTVTCPRCEGHGKVFLKDISEVKRCILCNGESVVTEKTSDSWKHYYFRKNMKVNFLLFDDPIVQMFLSQVGRNSPSIDQFQLRTTPLNPKVARMQFSFGFKKD